MITKEGKKSFVKESFGNQPKKNYIANEVKMFCQKNFWNLDLFDLNDYGPKKIKTIHVS